MIVEDSGSLVKVLRRFEREARRNGRVRIISAMILVEGDPRVVGALSRGVARVQKLEPLELKVSVIVLGRG